MNTLQYIIARCGIALGFANKNKLLTAAADEGHLLNQAEELLGHDSWSRVENIDAVSVEYWSLRKLHLKKEELEKSVEELSVILEESHEQKNVILEDKNESYSSLEDEYHECKERLAKLFDSKNEIIQDAQEIKRRMEASKMKLEVLGADSVNVEVVEEESEKIRENRASLIKLKGQRESVAEEISAVEAKIENYESVIAKNRDKLKAEASSVYHNIGKVNRDMSQLAAEIGLIDLDMSHHFRKIGHHLSSHYHLDSECAKACKESMALITQIRSLKASMALNYKLTSLI